MLALLFLLQPVPAVAMTPGPVQSEVVAVSCIVINQINRKSEFDGTYNTTVYVSFWDCYALPAGVERVPVWINRGWCGVEPINQCSHGWAVQLRSVTVVAPMLLFVTSSYDLEYRNRTPFWPIHH